MAKQKKPAKRQPKKQPKQKKRRWLWLKALSLLTFALALGFLWVLWMMDKEAQRLGLFDKVKPKGQPVSSGVSVQVEEIEEEEKKALEDILKERRGR